MSDLMKDAAQALRDSALKPGLPAPTPEYQAKNRAVALRKIQIAARQRR